MHVERVLSLFNSTSLTDRVLSHRLTAPKIQVNVAIDNQSFWLSAWPSAGKQQRNIARQVASFFVKHLSHQSVTLYIVLYFIYIIKIRFVSFSFIVSAKYLYWYLMNRDYYGVNHSISVIMLSLLFINILHSIICNHINHI